MRETKELLKLVLNYVENQGEYQCICDVLDRMYMEMVISFMELNFLHDYITEHIDERVIDSAINSDNAQLFIFHLRKLLEALQG